MNKENKTFDHFMEFLIVFLAFAYFFLVTFYSKKDEQILTAIIATMGVIVGYRWGSSKAGNSSKPTPQEGTTTIDISATTETKEA